MLLMVEKYIRGGIYHPIYRYAKANHKYMKDCDNNKESSYPHYSDVNNLFGWTMSQKLPLNIFKLIEDILNLIKTLLKIIMKKVMKDIFLKLMFNILKSYIIFLMIYHFYQKEWKLKKSKSLKLIYMIKLSMFYQKKFKTSIKSWINFEESS